jgi:eukaryotic-like serine/threonine-protein kinase
MRKNMLRRFSATSFPIFVFYYTEARAYRRKGSYDTGECRFAGVAGSAGQTIYTYHGQSTSISGVAWSLDGTRIASASTDGPLIVWEAFTGQTIFKWSNPNQNSISGIAWSPDGAYIAGADTAQGVQIWDATNGNIIFAYADKAGRVSRLAWSPNGTYIASGDYRGVVNVWRTP